MAIRSYKVEFFIELPEEYADEIEMVLYKSGLKHFPYEWSVGGILSSDDVED